MSFLTLIGVYKPLHNRNNVMKLTSVAANTCRVLKRGLNFDMEFFFTDLVHVRLSLTSVNF